MIRCSGVGFPLVLEIFHLSSHISIDFLNNFDADKIEKNAGWMNDVNKNFRSKDIDIHVIEDYHKIYEFYGTAHIYLFKLITISFKINCKILQSLQYF